MEDKILEIIKEKVKDSSIEIKGNSTFVEDLGMDSLDTVELVMAFEEELGVVIPDKDVDSLLTVDDVINYLQK
jgi:acyl carrier protein|tara:strand:- start:225 stop:443 length:219 start_codon:yes stop_codon:yes gene_type:complete